MATVTYAKATRIYPGSTKPAVDSLDLQIADGEFLVLVGPSGCGKSTSLRMLAGLEEIDAGAVYIDETDVTNVPPKARDIAMVFQNYALYPHMTVYENMAFALKLRKTPKPEIDRRVKEAARLLNMDEALLSRKPKALSGGQRQRVAMGRAIVREPQVFLMDEPLSNLDAKLRVQTRAQIAALQQRLGVTTVYVTHDQVEAMTMGDRVAVLLDGVLQQVDGPRSLYDKPANAFVAGFIGSPAMNLRTVKLTDNGADFGGMLVPLTREQVAAARADGGDGKVTIGFRPNTASWSGPARAASRSWSSWSRSWARTRTCTATRPSTAAAPPSSSWSAPTGGSSPGWARPCTCGRAPAPSTCSTRSPAPASRTCPTAARTQGPGRGHVRAGSVNRVRQSTVWVAAVGGFVAVTAALALAPVRALDLAARDLADAHRPPAADLAAQWVNRLGSGGLLTSLALLIALVLCWRRRSAWPIAPVAAAFLATGVVILPLKWLFHRAAPHSVLPDDVEVRLFSQADGLSYPSGHGVNVIVWYGVLCLLLGAWLTDPVRRWVRWVPPVAVTLAGTYLGYHWFTDMLAGLCLGVLLDRALMRVPWPRPVRADGPRPG
jgi:multiple sugar transport system ATP-binding protein